MSVTIMMVLLPMRVNNQRVFQEFALQTPKTKPFGFVRYRKYAGTVTSKQRTSYGVRSNR
jgi:hypothetical protein